MTRAVTTLCIVFLVLAATMATAGTFFPIGVWYEGGVGAYRNDLIPEDPRLAAIEYRRDFSDLAAHGINAAVVPNTQPNHHKPLLDAAADKGVKLIVELDKNGGELGEIVRGGLPLTNETTKNTFDTKLKPIEKHPALLGVQLLDEPGGGSYDRYRTVAASLKTYAPKLVPFCCLAGVGNVEEFLTRAKPEVVAFDCYPVGVGNPIGDPRPMLGFQGAALQASLAGLKHQVPVWAVLQVHSITGIHRFPTPAEIRCMTYLSLAVGCKGIYWFLYQTEYWNKDRNEFMGGLVDQNFKGDERWVEVGKLAREIRKLVPTLQQLQLAPDAVVTAANAQAHVLTDSAGRVYVFAVNTDTLKSRRVTVRLDQPAGSRSMEVVKQPSGSIIQAGRIADKLIWTDTLAPGDGALYMVR